MKIPSILLILILALLAACQATPALSEVEGPAPTAPLASATPPPPTAPVPTNPPTATTTPNPPTPTATPTITATPAPPRAELLFTGAIVPARCVQAEIDARGEADYLYAEVRSLIEKADLAIGTLNAALSDYPPHTGCVQTFVLVGGSINADAMARAGFDLVSAATNHIKNCGLTSCGDRAFLDTLANLERVGITPIGAGLNLADALQPVVVTLNGIRFGFVSLGEIEPNAFAGPDTPGIAILTEENLRQAIAAARAVSDVVIAMPHWGPDYASVPNYRQLRFAQVAVDAGADLVIGNHAHVIQGMQTLDGVLVFYGLGSFVFDQDWSRETQQGIMVRVRFLGTEVEGYDVIPVHIDGNGRVYVASAEEAAEILGRFHEISAEIP